MSAPKHDEQSNPFAAHVRGALECGRSLLSQRFKAAEKMQEERELAEVSKRAGEENDSSFSLAQRAFR